MKEKYWQQFVSTGKIEDYLGYKNINYTTQSQGKTEDTGANCSESDSTDGNGFVSNAHRRV